MVDGVDEVGPDRKHVWHARQQQDLEQIERLAKSAIGFDEKRGDRVEVVSMPFINAIDPAEPELAIRPDMARHDLVGLAEALALGVTAFVIIVLMTRSIIKGLKGSPVSMAIAGQTLESLQAGGGGLSHALTTTSAGGGGGSPLGGQAALVDDTTVSLNQIEGQIRISSIRKLIELTNHHPDTTLAIIRGWMAG